MRMHIRDFQESDRSDLVALWETCALTRPWNAPDADIDRCLNARDATILVGIVNDKLIASVMAGIDGHRGWVYYLAVSPDVRQRGRGREMMAEAELWLKARGAPKVQLMVRGGNGGAAAFYEALGFDLQDVVVLGKWIAPVETV